MTYTTLDFYKVLIAEKKGMPSKGYEEQRSRKEMKDFIFKHFETEDITVVKYK